MIRDLRPLLSWLVDVACRVSLPRLPWSSRSVHGAYLHGYRDGLRDGRPKAAGEAKA